MQQSLHQNQPPGDFNGLVGEREAGVIQYGIKTLFSLDVTQA